MFVEKSEKDVFEGLRNRVQELINWRREAYERIYDLEENPYMTKEVMEHEVYMSIRNKLLNHIELYHEYTEVDADLRYLESFLFVK